VVPEESWVTPQAGAGTGLSIIQAGSEMLKEKRAGNMKSREDAVSEAIGFILIFSLVMIGIGLITLYGYPILLEQQSNANVKNMERDMIVLQNDMKSLVYKNAPYKETSLQVSGGALAVHNCTSSVSYMTVSLSNGTTVIADNKFGQLIYESDTGESIIAMENGAVFTRMEFQNGSAMLAEPRWFIDNNTITAEKALIITLVNISSDGSLSRNGIGTVKMQMLPPKDQIMMDTTSQTIYITYNKESDKYDFSKGWENYFKNSLGMSGSYPTYSINGIDSLIIKQYEIKILSI
jgi:hypothetical protein